MPPRRHRRLSRTPQDVPYPVTTPGEASSSSGFVQSGGPDDLIDDILEESTFVRNGEDTQEPTPTLRTNEVAQNTPSAQLVQVLRDTRFTGAGEPEDILAATCNLRNGLNIPMLGDYHGSDSEVDNVGVDFYSDYDYDYDSDSLSEYSQDDGATDDSPLYSTREPGHDAVSPEEPSSEPPPSSLHNSPLESPTSGETTPPVATAPTEHLTNVLRHGLQSRNRRLNRRQRVQSSPPLLLVPSDQVDNALTSFPLRRNASRTVQHMCASWPVEIYRGIVRDVFREVYGEELKPY